MIRPQGKFLVPAGPNLKNSAWPSIISLLRRESSLLAEEFQHGSVLLPFEKGEDECNSRGHTDQYAERKAEGVHGKGRAGDLLNLAHGWASSINGAASYSLFRFCPWDNTGMVGELVLCSWKVYPKLVQRTEKTVTTSGRKKILPLCSTCKNKLPCCTFTYSTQA